MKKIILPIALFFSCLGPGYAQQPAYLNSSSEINSISALSEAGLPSTLPDVKYHLTARPWQALNISKDDYLDRVEGIVREIVKFQNSTGAIIDPYAYREVQYSTPYFANAMGTLISAGRAMDLLNKGVAAMNSATADIAEGRNSIPDDHGEFFLAPLASAIPLYTPFVSSSQLKTWQERMAKPIAGIIRGSIHNWRTYAMKGEWNRAGNGYVNKDTAVLWLENSWLNTQKNRFTDNSWNFYHDKSSDPDTWPYESVARSNLLSMIDEGYNGASRNEILNILKKGTQSSLLFQDPSGQVAAGGRSGNHTWNDILLANGYETMAEIAFKEGNTRLAGQYRHAAALAFQSVQRWRRSDGTYSVTKNHFNPANKIGYAKYSVFANYNGNMMYHMAENYLKHKTYIQQRATPNEIGGYTIISDEKLATAVANAGGMHMQVCLRGSTAIAYNRYWTTLGVARFARPGWDSRLGPSDGVRDTSKGFGVSFAPTFLDSGYWVRLASVPDRYEAFFTTQFTHPLLVRCRVEYKPKSGKTGPTFTNDFIITPDGILSTLTSTSANFGITWPLLIFDGETKLNTGVTTNIASTSYPGETDEQNFIALHSSPVITTTDATVRSSYGDLLPVRMVSGAASNITFIYPRNSADPSADSVRKSYVRSGNDFSTILGKVRGDTYVGRTSAGGVATSIDINNDSTADAIFNISTGFVMQLENGKITRIEADRDVTGVVQGQIVNLKAYTPCNLTDDCAGQINSGKLEAEEAVLNGAKIAADKPGYTGSAFVDYLNLYEDFIEWTFKAPAAGSYSLQFRYANGGVLNRPLKLEVNGIVVVASLDFSPTGDWKTWSFSSAIANLNIGTNKIKLTAIGFSGPNVDHLIVGTVVCQPGALEAEQAFLNGAVVASDHAGFTGPGFADYQNASGDFVEWTVNALLAGSYSLQFRYANGGVADRPLRLEINGTVVGSPAFSPTGSWTTWSVSSATASLKAGTNKVRLTAIGSSGPNLDHLAFSCSNFIASVQKPVLAKSMLPALSSDLLRAYVAPNPVSDILNVFTTGLQRNKQATISVISASGVVMKTRQLINSTQTIQLNVSSLVSGVYIIKLISGDKIFYKQFVKM